MKLKVRFSSLDAHAFITFMYSNISACLLIPVQVLPEGIEAVNGSSTDMGCTSALVDSGDVMTCNSQSYLVDSCSPDIDTSTSDWASQLVTVRRNEGTAAVPIPHVLLTFGFDTAVSLTRIEIDLFLVLRASECMSMKSTTWPLGSVFPFFVL